MRSDPLLQFLGVGLYPAKDRSVVDFYTSIEQHQLEIAIADWEHQVPTDRHKITSSVNCRLFNLLLRPIVLSNSCTASASPYPNRAIATTLQQSPGAHSPRRYLHIEAVFVFDSQADHLSVASGQADRRTRNTHNRK
jgi:hypothetical protein